MCTNRWMCIEFNKSRENTNKHRKTWGNGFASSVPSQISVLVIFCSSILGPRYCICFNLISFSFTLHFSALPAVVREAIRCALGAWLWRYGGLSCGGQNSIHHRSGPLGWYWSSPGLIGEHNEMNGITNLINMLCVMERLFQHCKEVLHHKQQSL